MKNSGTLDEPMRRPDLVSRSQCCCPGHFAERKFTEIRLGFRAIVIREADDLFGLPAFSQGHTDATQPVGWAQTVSQGPAQDFTVTFGENDFAPETAL